MDSIDRLAEKLKREPIEDVIRKCYEYDGKSSSYTFTKMNSENEWHVAYHLEWVVKQSGWTVDEFNKEVDYRFKRGL